MGHSGQHGHGEWKWLGNGALRGEDPDVGLGHIVDVTVFNKVLAALMALTFITVLASRFDFGQMNTVIAIVIASIKALLVALFFMHLKFERKLIILYSVYPLILLALFIGSSVLDVADREHPLPSWKMKEDDLAKPAPEMHHDAHAPAPGAAAHGGSAPAAGTTHSAEPHH